jgi:dephospho-CoA kinase
VAAVEAAFPGVTSGGAVDRRLLSERVVNDPDALARLEAIVHPLVRESEAGFLARCRGSGRPLAVIDVPLLFEVGAAGRADVIVVATADAATQRARLLARPGMTAAKFESLLARQLPDEEKRRRAHFLVPSCRGLAVAERQVAAILRALAFGG